MSALAAIRDDGSEAGCWGTIAAAARAIDLPCHKVGEALRKSRMCGGYRWEHRDTAPCFRCGLHASEFDARGLCLSCGPGDGGVCETPSDIVTRYGIEALSAKTDDELKALTGYATAAQKRKYFRLRAKIHGAWE